MRAVSFVVIAGCGRVAFDAQPDAKVVADAAADAITACTVAACPSPFAVIDGGCYALFSTPAGWLDAELACESFGAHLIVQDSVDEHFTVHDDIAVGVPAVWVGWTDRRGPDNVFMWVVPDQGGLLQSNTCVFGVGEPDAGDTAHCVAQDGLNSCGDYNDVDCGTLLPYVCECDGVLADPTRY